MSWTEVLNHQLARERFERSLTNQRLGSTYLFVGPVGVGKHLFALKLAEALLCENPPAQLQPCGTCPACVQVRAKTHPDLLLISKPADRAFIPLDLFIGTAEHRRQTGLCHEIGLKPSRGKRKIAILDDADYLNIEGANALLKTLEEPPPNSLLILIGSSEQKQLSTIVSRSQIVRFGPLTDEEVAQILSKRELETTVAIDELAAASGGSVARALALAEDDVFQFRSSFLANLASLEPGRNAFAEEVVAFVDAAGKDSALKRERLVLAGDFAIDFFQRLATTIFKAALNADDKVMAASVTEASELLRDRRKRSPQEIAESAGTCIERTINLQTDVRTNASPANIVAPWLRDLAKVLHGEPVLL